jgi:hypothetical protein
MKKSVSLLICIVLCLTLMLPITAMAASAGASLSGPGTVRAGDTITLTFNLSGSGIYGASGTLSYDSSQLTLSGTSQKISSPWAVEFNGNNFVAYDNNLTNPINSSKALFTVTFKVNSSLAAGTAIKVSYTGVTASDGSTDASIGTVSYSATIAAPLSTDNTLKSLTVSNATISPAFSSSTTSYTASVPYEVSKLDVKANANDSKAKVSIDNPTLTVNGTTKVTITVKAENGSTKIYTISVKRAQDPNYVPSSENNLSSITVDGFLLSPVFSAENTKYVIWLPYETENVTIGGTAADSKASVKVIGGDSLIAGADNEIQIVCTAENGTEKVYTIIAKRAAAHGATEPEETIPEETTPEETEPEETVPPATEPVEAPTEKSNGVAAWVTILVGVLCLGAGVGAGILVDKKFLIKK